jgi:pyruvate formate lyase activating enzyme
MKLYMKREKINVNFGQIIPISTVDWHKKSVCMVFFNGCPFNCIWCQNYKLLNHNHQVDINIVMKKIDESMDFVSGVVFSGGEPTSQENVLDMLLRFVKRHDLLTGIQTNGYYPLVIKKLIEHNLVDKIFLDIKAPISESKYKAITCVADAYKKVAESFNIINMSHVNSEIRTTVFRPYIQDVFDIATFLGSRDYRGTYVLQTGIPNHAPEGDIRKEQPINSAEMSLLSKKVAKDTGLNVKYT